MEFYYQNGEKKYEGEVTWNEMQSCYAPNGKGIRYFRNGNIWQKGVFLYWWLIEGEEYTEDGCLLFKGTLNGEERQYYGPTYFVEGILYNKDGSYRYIGALETKKIGGLG
ncbi:MAG: hypothetical protein PHR20_08230, partial [Bacteroidales bacterium]|nr:hypothetical protein [Bacteroidales bacterium]